MRSIFTIEQEREHLEKRFPKLTSTDFNDLYSLYPFNEYHVINRVKVLIYWYEVLGEKKEVTFYPDMRK